MGSIGVASGPSPFVPQMTGSWVQYAAHAARSMGIWHASGSGSGCASGPNPCCAQYAGYSAHMDATCDPAKSWRVSRDSNAIDFMIVLCFIKVRCARS